MGKKLAFWGDCNGCGYKIIRILEELGGINVSNYCGNEVTSLYYIDEKNRIKCTYNGDLDKEKYVVMTYHDFIAKYPHQVHDIVYTAKNHEKGEIVEIVWDETKGQMRYLVYFECTASWMYADDIFSYEPKDNSDRGTAIKPMKVKSNAVKLVDGKVVDNLDEGKIMNKKLAIVGHPTRGNEVIELLEMMGGVNSKNLDGKCDFLYFFIDNENIIWCDSNFNNNFVYFTLEKFLKENPYKVGDKVIDGYGNSVTIKSMKWSEDFETMVYDFEETEDVFCAEDLEAVNDTNEVFLKIEKNTNMNIEFDLIKYSYEVKDGKLVISEKKPKYPDNYEECVRIAKNIHGYDIHIDVPAYGELMESFVKLLICRDAYWKIAGEEMGLDKPWNPKFGKYIHYNINFYLYKDNFTLHKGEYHSPDNRILVFPTEEMRDAFYENFKDMIEQCKELL